MNYEESIKSYWNYWCYYKRVLRNKITGVETLIESKSYSPSVFGLVRAGIKKFDLSSTEEIIEYYLTALKPPIIRMCNQDLPVSAEFTLNFSEHSLNEGEVKIEVKIKPWANSSGSAWTSATEITYQDISEYYIPFDLSISTYDSTIYEKIQEADLSGEKVEFDNVIQTFQKFLQDQSTGFILSATGGYCEIYGPSHDLYFLRPKFVIDQPTVQRFHCNVDLDTEIKAASKIKGVCRDREGAIITGHQCKISAFDPYSFEVIGTGLSSSVDGSFLVDIEYKVGNPVIVSFVDETLSLYGTEIMVSVSESTV